MSDLREKVLVEIDGLMDNVRSDCRTNRCVAADRILALVEQDREKLVKACEGIVANIEGGKLPVTLKGVAGSLRAALAGKEWK